MRNPIQSRSVSISVLAALAVGAFITLSQRPGMAAGPATQPVETAAIRELVRQEVAAEVREQLPSLVAAEVKRQLDEVLRQASAHSRVPLALNTEQTVRSQLSLYALQHNDQFPTLAQLQQGWSVLTHATDATGRIGTSAEAQYGPYLAATPANPFNGSDSVAPIGAATPKTGWTYDEKTGRLLVVIPAQFRQQIMERDGEVPSATAAADTK